MENVLYEYSFNFENIYTSFIPLFIGVGFFIKSISLLRKKGGNKNFVDLFFKIIGFIVGPVCVGLALISVLGYTLVYNESKEILENDDCYVVEGYVENFYSMPYEGHDTEHFEINGVYFEYSDYIMTNGYNVTASHGGVVAHNGQYLKIKYIIDEYDEEDGNTILYIAEIEKEWLFFSFK